MSSTEPQSVIHPQGSGDALVDPAVPVTAPTTGDERTGSIPVKLPEPEGKKITPPVRAGRHVNATPDTPPRATKQEKILIALSFASLAGLLVVVGWAVVVLFGQALGWLP